jgi:hypothetical protein
MYTTKTNPIARLSPLCAALLLGACANQESLTERNFGESVRQMIQAQTYDPSTLTMPSAEPVDGTDGQMLEGAVEVYRSDVASPEGGGNEVVINVGSGQR